MSQMGAYAGGRKKLTVGLELAALTGFKVLLDHLTDLPADRDLRAELVAVHSRLRRELRVRMLEDAADAGINLIAT